MVSQTNFVNLTLAQLIVGKKNVFPKIHQNNTFFRTNSVDSTDFQRIGPKGQLNVLKSSVKLFHFGNRTTLRI